MTLIEHKGLGLSTELKEIRQRDLERFYKRQREVWLEMGVDPTAISLPEYSGAVIRIASELDFFSERFEDIDNWKPAKTSYLKDELVKAIVEATTIPPE